jgi:hypothetical protein
MSHPNPHKSLDIETTKVDARSYRYEVFLYMGWWFEDFEFKHHSSIRQVLKRIKERTKSVISQPSRIF